MPRNDQTGPNGNGPMTGRGLGVGNTTNKSFYGRGRGMGRGRGFGRRLNEVNVPTLEEEKEQLQNRLDEINKIMK